MSKKKIIAVMPVMKGGGAERVASLLINEFYKNGYDCEFLLTSSETDEAIKRDLCDEIPLTSLQSELKPNAAEKLFYKLLRVLTSIICRLFEAMKISVPAFFAYLSFVSDYHAEIKAMRSRLKSEPDTTVIAFLLPSIPITLLAARGLENRMIISERGDPGRILKKRYGYNFIKKYYERADAVVFQTDSAKNAYPENISRKGTVIFNPVKKDLPEAYHGERNKNITTFCRISKEKNLPLLAEAFAMLHKEHGNYRLRIIGDAFNDSDREALRITEEKIKSLGITEYADFLQFSSDVHKNIVSDAMYVNSSDHEGMSNAMLEAMAIGMPVVCTDCPIGGAEAVIENGKNGLLVEVGNSKEIYEAMKKIIENKAFANLLSENAAEIRDRLSIEKITERWLELV